MNHNPAWDDLLGIIPEELHEQVTPHLEKWDQNYQRDIETFKPYKEVIDKHEWDHDTFNSFVDLVDNMQNNPLEVYQNYGNYLRQQGLLEEPGNAGYAGNDEDDDDDIDDDIQSEDPRVQALMDFVIAKEEAEREQQEMQAFQQEVDKLQQKYKKDGYGEFDTTWVFAHALAEEKDLEDAVKDYYNWESTLLQSRRANAIPRAFGGSGTYAPSSKPVDISKLSDRDRKAYAAQYLAQMNTNE